MQKGLLRVGKAVKYTHSKQIKSATFSTMDLWLLVTSIEYYFLMLKFYKLFLLGVFYENYWTFSEDFFGRLRIVRGWHIQGIPYVPLIFQYCNWQHFDSEEGT